MTKPTKAIRKTLALESEALCVLAAHELRVVAGGTKLTNLCQGSTGKCVA